MKHSKHGASLTPLVWALLACLAATGAPAAVEISADPTQNMSCSGGVCSPTASDAVLNAGDLTAMLASGAVTVTTTGSGVEANDIRVSAPFSWASASALTLAAHLSIVFDAPVGVHGLAPVSLATGPAPALFFFHGASLSFANSSDVLTINAKRYRLEPNLTKLARAVTAHPAGAYALAQDIDARHDRVYPTSPIAVPFAGSFTGLGHVVLGISIADMASANVGLFARVRPEGMLANIGTQRAVVAGTQSVGGLVGLNEGTVSNAFTDGIARGEGENVGSFNLVGGLVGYNGGTVIDCQSDVRASGGYATGGLVGENSGTVESSFATGPSTAISYAGGLVGWNSGNPVTIHGTIIDSYATGNARGQAAKPAAVGGLVGFNPGFSGILSTIATSYSTGTARSAVDGSLLGGFIGRQTGAATSAYWDTTTSAHSQAVGSGDSTGITGLTTAELQSGLLAGFDPAVWAESPSVNGGYRYLIANPPIAKRRRPGTARSGASGPR